MNDLLFTALTLALLYYCFYYLPQQKQLIFSESKAVQTEPFTNPDEQALANTLDELIKQIKQLNHEIR